MTAPALLSFFSGEGRRHLDFVFFFPFCLFRWESCAFSRLRLRIYGKIKNRGGGTAALRHIPPPCKADILQKAAFRKTFSEDENNWGIPNGKSLQPGLPCQEKGRPRAAALACGAGSQSSGFMVGNRKPVLCIPPQVPISSALPGSWAIMFLYCFIIFHRHFLNWCKIRCKLTYPDLPLKINKAGHFSFLRSFIVNIHCCRDIRMPHDFLNNLEIFLVLAKASAKCMP